jgi:CRP-like cAMP-binding protein
LEVNVLGEGFAFGEAALLDSKARTSATVLAKENCEFACIDRKSFWDILGRF